LEKGPPTPPPKTFNQKTILWSKIFGKRYTIKVNLFKSFEEGCGEELFQKFLPTSYSYYYFGFPLKMRAVMKPKPNAAVMPAAVAVSPPVSAPKSPCSATAFSTPLARV